MSFSSRSLCDLSFCFETLLHLAAALKSRRSPSPPPSQAVAASSPTNFMALGLQGDVDSPLVGSSSDAAQTLSSRRNRCSHGKWLKACECFLKGHTSESLLFKGPRPNAPEDGKEHLGRPKLSRDPPAHLVSWRTHPHLNGVAPTDLEPTVAVAYGPQ